MKKSILLVTIMFLIIPITVGAKEKYTTQNGITMEKELYNELCSIYSEGYVETLGVEEFNNLTNSSLKDIKKTTYVEKVLPSIVPYGAYYSTNSKSVSLIKNGNYVTLLGSWKVNPTVKSYDVIGIRLSGVTLNGSFTFKQTYVSNGSYKVTYNGNNKTLSNGFGSSALLQAGSNQEYSLTFMVSGSGTIYGTYQHATSSVTLNQSKDYTISSSGLRNVLDFSSSVRDKYDKMTGVDLIV